MPEESELTRTEMLQILASIARDPNTKPRERIEAMRQFRSLRDDPVEDVMATFRGAQDRAA